MNRTATRARKAQEGTLHRKTFSGHAERGEAATPLPRETVPKQARFPTGLLRAAGKSTPGAACAPAPPPSLLLLLLGYGPRWQARMDHSNQAN